MMLFRTLFTHSLRSDFIQGILGVSSTLLTHPIKFVPVLLGQIHAGGTPVFKGTLLALGTEFMRSAHSHETPFFHQCFTICNM